jgi:hypothetical protein
MSLDSIAGLVCREADPDVVSCSRSNDKLAIGGVTLDSINYFFYKKQFYKVDLWSEPSLQHPSLRTYFTEAFGSPKSGSYQRQYLTFHWEAGSRSVKNLARGVHIHLTEFYEGVYQYQHATTISYQPIADQVERDRTERNKDKYKIPEGDL